MSETQVQYSVVLDSSDAKGGWERGQGLEACSSPCAHSFVLLVGENFPASRSPKILICFPLALITGLICSHIRKLPDILPKTGNIRESFLQ